MSFSTRAVRAMRRAARRQVYGLAIARDLALLEGWTAYYFANGRVCDGIAPRALVRG